MSLCFIIVVFFTIEFAVNSVEVFSQLYVSGESSVISVEINTTCTVTYVVDGDTLDCDGVRIRLADINAPELDQSGGVEAKNALRDLVLNKKIFLDIDDVEPRDKYGRVVAVVYVRFNETHLLNVNKWLVDSGYAEIWDFPNETNPYDWKLYEYYPVELEEEHASTSNSVESLLKLLGFILKWSLPVILVALVMASILVLMWRGEF